jgi:hypothetical protein
MHASLARDNQSMMNIIWRLPDGTVKEQAVADMEQLLFVLRMIRNVSIEGSLYAITGSSLVVESDRLSVAITLS